MLKETLLEKGYTLPDTFAVGSARAELNPPLGIALAGHGAENARLRRHSTVNWDELMLCCNAYSDGENLALTGAIRDEIMDVEMLACVLAGRLRERYPELLIVRYKLKPEDLEDTQDFELAERIGRKRGFLISGGEVNFLRTANMLLDEFRGGKLGRITIEVPECEE